MQFSKSFLYLATATVLLGLCIGVGIAFLLACEQQWCQFAKQAQVTSFEECVVQGNPVMESYPRQCRTYDGKLFVEEIPDEHDEAGSINVMVTSPKENQFVGKVFTVTGEARVFENTVSYRLRDQDKVLIESFATAHSADVGRFGPFSFNIDASHATGKVGTLEVFQFSAKDGSEVDKVTVRVRFE